jgi:hypothetical protein
MRYTRDYRHECADDGHETGKYYGEAAMFGKKCMGLVEVFLLQYCSKKCEMS